VKRKVPCYRIQTAEYRKPAKYYLEASLGALGVEICGDRNGLIYLRDSLSELIEDPEGLGGHAHIVTIDGKGEVDPEGLCIILTEPENAQKSGLRSPETKEADLLPSSCSLSALLSELDAEVRCLSGRLKQLEDKRDGIRFLKMVAELLERGVVVMRDGGYGKWFEWESYFNPKDGVLHFLSANVSNYEKDVPLLRGEKDRSYPAYVVPREYFVGLDPRMRYSLEVPVVPLTEVKHDACPECGALRPVMEWYHEIYGSPDGDLCERIIFLVCCGGLQVLHRRQFGC